MRRSWQLRSLLSAALLISVLQVPAASAQQPVSAEPPYATMNRDTVTYRGPGRANSSDLQTSVATIGILLPLQGPDSARGKLLLHAAQLAIDDENAAAPLSDGRRFALAAENVATSWGQASSAMVHLITEQQSVALITGPDGNLAHQAEQIANKIGIPIVTLSSDTTTTQINIPWIFRMAPSDQQQAAVLADDLYRSSPDRHVVLVAAADHDGRAGQAEFLKAVQSKGIRSPQIVEIDPSSFRTTEFAKALASSKADVVVIWTDSALAAQLPPVVGEIQPSPLIYLCQKASLASGAESEWRAYPNAFEIVTMLAPESAPTKSSSHPEQFAPFSPGSQEQQMYLAVRLVAAAVRMSGINRARLRDALAQSVFTTASNGAERWFDAAGNLQVPAQLIPVQTLALSSAH